MARIEMPYTLLGSEDTEFETLGPDIVQKWEASFLSMSTEEDYLRMLYMMLGCEESQIGSDVWDKCNYVVKSFVIMMKLARDSSCERREFGYLEASIVDDTGKPVIMSMAALPSLDGTEDVDKAWVYNQVPIVWDEGEAIVFDLYLRMTGTVADFCQSMADHFDDIMGRGNVLCLVYHKIDWRGLVIVDREEKIPLVFN